MNPDRSQVRTSIAMLAACAALLPGCKEEKPSAAAQSGSGGNAAAPAPTNRVDIPATVRQNLGITFARVELRSVGRTIRIPGHFEPLPSARREYRASFPGKVDLIVDQYARVDVGTPLYRIDSPRLRELQGQLTEAEASIRLAKAGVASMPPLKAAHQRHEEGLRTSVEVWAKRLEQLQQVQAAGGGKAEEQNQARAAHAAASADLGEVLEKDAELDARELSLKAELESAKARFHFLLVSVSSLTGLSADELLRPDKGDQAAWKQLAAVEVRASAPGVVDSLAVTSGAWVEQPALIMASVQPERVRFRARGLQSDLGRLRDGLTANVVPPLGGSLAASEALAGTVGISPTANPEQRTIELIWMPGGTGVLPEWSRAGVSAFLEIAVDQSKPDELAIPLACVARDGLSTIIFRRDPKDPNKVIRMEADLGVDDGRWVAIKSGVREGDEIVLEGVYQLMVATSGSITKGGHFHADGTFHEGDR